MKTSDFDYDLPPEFIAQTPVEPRDASRLLVYHRETGEVEHRIFRDIGEYLGAGDLLVLNQTRVIPARLAAFKIPTGGRIEVLLLKRVEPALWEVIIGGKGMTTGKWLGLGPPDRSLPPMKGEIVAEFEGARRLVRFDAPLESVLDQIGEVPLPPYIHEKLANPERYQTVYAAESGSAAAPTAGLHFTPELMARLAGQGVGFARVTLHVGLDTFAPVHADDPREHPIHSEWCSLPQMTADAINAARRAGGRVIAVGTTSVRTLESAAQPDGTVTAFEGPTELFILPGYAFRAVQGMVTNFHLPKSTLLMMLSALVGREQILGLYETAKREGYRFFSFGDAILII